MSLVNVSKRIARLIGNKLLKWSTLLDPATSARSGNKISIDDAYRAVVADVKDRSLKQALKLYRQGALDAARFVHAFRLYKKATYLEDICGTLANAEFLNDPKFVHAYDTAKAISGWGRDIRWRAYIFMSCAQHGMALDGDFVECGTDRGGMALASIVYLAQTSWQRKFYLFDTFEGLVGSQMADVEREITPVRQGRYIPVYDEVLKTFAPYPFVVPIKGAVPDSLRGFEGDTVSFLHIDMNVAYPEVAAMEFFWPRLVPGAMVLFDDYAFPKHAPQKQALDAFMQRVESAIITLPTGQGLLIR